MKTRITTILRATAVAGILLTVAGCTTSTPGQNGGILSDRGCIPPPAAEPAKTSAPSVIQNDIPTVNVTFPTTTSEKEPPLPAGTVAATPETTTESSNEPTFVSAKDGSVIPQDNKEGDATAADKAPAAKKEKRKYKVAQGDTLSGIAYRYNISWKELAKENNLTEKSILKPGQELTLPEKAADKPRAPRKSSGKKKATSSNNKTTSQTAGEPIPADGFHVVQQGDSLWKIAYKYRVNSNDIRALNPNIEDFSKLQIGDRLKLPEKKAAKENEPAKAPTTAAPQVEPQTTSNTPTAKPPVTATEESSSQAPDVNTEMRPDATQNNAPKTRPTL